MEMWQLLILLAGLLFGPAGGVVLYSRFGIDGVKDKITGTNAAVLKIEQTVDEGFAELRALLDVVREAQNNQNVDIARLQEGARAQTGWIRRIEKIVHDGR